MLDNNGVLSFGSSTQLVAGTDLQIGQVVRNEKTGNAMIIIGGSCGEQLGTAVRGQGAKRPGRTDVFGWSTDPDGNWHAYALYLDRNYQLITTINQIQG